MTVVGDLRLQTQKLSPALQKDPGGEIGRTLPVEGLVPRSARHQRVVLPGVRQHEQRLARRRLPGQRKRNPFDDGIIQRELQLQSLRM